jgi:pimeloyl-ACP methyl ester carboxylesterase
MIQDFESSGLIDLAAKDYRVIVFDRPGFGHSLRPRNVVWTPEAQADLFKKALDRLSVQRAIVLGHSWGASVAVALAARQSGMLLRDLAWTSAILWIGEACHSGATASSQDSRRSRAPGDMQRTDTS